MTPFGKILNPALKKLRIHRQYHKNRPLAAWDKVVEPELLAYTTPRSIKNGILYIATPSDVWAAQFSARRHVYLRELNELLGKNKLRGIKFTVSRSAAVREIETAAAVEEKPAWMGLPLGDDEKKELQERLTEVEDSELKKKLAVLLSKELRFKIWKKGRGWHECKDCGTLIDLGNRCPFCRIRRSGRLY